MNVFEQYAQYYHLLYHDKNYAQEAQYVHQLLQRFAPNACSILELGCGTGQHACLFAEYGYAVAGIDQSTVMLREADDRRVRCAPAVAARLVFRRGDIRDIRLAQQFDAVLSLFHVMSYQTTNDDFAAVLNTVQTHLTAGGILLFDFWYGPAVLTDPPVVRVKRFEDEHIQVTRIAEPLMSPNENMVTVRYEVVIEEKRTHKIERIYENHQMRYWFYPELHDLLVHASLTILHAAAWMKPEQPLGFESWNGVVIAQKT